MAFPYAITLSSFLNVEDVHKSLENLSDMGFDQIEVFGEPEETDLRFMNDILMSFNFKVMGVTGMWGKISPSGWKRRMLSNDFSYRKCSEIYVLKCVKMCRYLGGNKLNVCLFSDPVNSFDVT